jgi:hypothetical protein
MKKLKKHHNWNQYSEKELLDINEKITDAINYKRRIKAIAIKAKLSIGQTVKIDDLEDRRFLNKDFVIQSIKENHAMVRLFYEEKETFITYRVPLSIIIP